MTTWMPEATDLLRKLYADGASFDQIRQEITRVFGHVLSRNAVIGRAHRIGLHYSESEVSKRRASQTKRPRSDVQVREHARVSAAPKDRRLTNNNPLRPRSHKPSPEQRAALAAVLGRVPFAGPSVSTALRPEPVADVVPLLVPLVDLHAGDCRWPLGDGPFVFCALPALEGSSYCRAHHALATRAPYRNETVARLERIASAP